MWLGVTIPFLYVLMRLIVPLRAGWKIRVAWGAVLFAVAFKFQILRRFAGPMFFAPDLPGWLQALTTWLFVIFFLMFFFLLIADAVRLAVWAVRLAVRRPALDREACRSRRSIGNAVNLGLLVLASLLAARGMDNAIKLPPVRRVEVVLPQLPPELDGMTVALLADLHVDMLTPSRHIEEAVARTNALDPDLVLLAGDYADGTVEKLGDKLRPLGKLRGRRGVFAVPGNHEYYSGYREWLDFLSSLGIAVLENANRGILPSCHVAGITDPAALRHGEAAPDLDSALKGIPPGAFVILLAHQLRDTHEAAARGVALQLSGHTHGGMIVGFDRIVAAFNRGFVAGKYQVGPMVLYVSRGTFLWRGFPVRLGVPPEIALLTLRRK